MESLIQSGSVVWSDESRFQLHSDAQERCVQRSGEKYNSEWISATVKHGGRSAMAWGAFSAAGTGELLHCEKSINALEYMIILQKGLLPTIEKLFSKVEQLDIIFQQDNTPAHTAKTTKTWLENKSIRLKSRESRLEPYREYLVSH